MLQVPLLLRSIGEHNWEDGKYLIEKQNTNFLCVQCFYGSDKHWNFCITKKDGIFYREIYNKNSNDDIWILKRREPFPTLKST